MPVKGVLISALVARVRKIVSAAMNPPGVRLIALERMEAGPSSVGLDLGSLRSAAVVADDCAISPALLLIVSRGRFWPRLLVVTASLAFTSLRRRENLRRPQLRELRRSDDRACGVLLSAIAVAPAEIAASGATLQSRQQ